VRGRQMRTSGGDFCRPGGDRMVPISEGAHLPEVNPPAKMSASKLGAIVRGPRGSLLATLLLETPGTWPGPGWPVMPFTLGHLYFERSRSVGSFMSCACTAVNTAIAIVSHSIARCILTFSTCLRSCSSYSSIARNAYPVTRYL
jgi:hypothetical protein